MLKVISLHTINEIFETEALTKISPMAKMSYIQCLLYYFKDKDPNMSNLIGFDINKRDFKKYNEKYFNELRDAGLIIVSEKTITFINHWSNHIDKTLLEKMSPTEYLALVNYKSINELEDLLYKNQSVYELIIMNNKIKPEQAIELIKLFVANQKGLEKMYNSPSELFQHCINWCGKNVHKVKHIGIKSKKILGL